MEDTFSINDGPEVPVSKFADVVDFINRADAEQQHTALKDFFAEIDRREEDCAAIRTEINDCFDSYCSSTATNKDALKLAYKLFKAINKDKNKAEVMQFEYDKMADLLLPAETERWKQGSLL